MKFKLVLSFITSYFLKLTVSLKTVKVFGVFFFHLTWRSIEKCIWKFLSMYITHFITPCYFKNYKKVGGEKKKLHWETAAYIKADSYAIKIHGNQSSNLSSWKCNWNKVHTIHRWLKWLRQLSEYGFTNKCKWINKNWRRN